MVSLWFCVTSAPTPAHNQCPFQRTFPLSLSLSLRHWSSFWCSSIDFSVQCTYNFVPLSLFPASSTPSPSLFLCSSSLQLAACILSKGNRNLFTKHFIVPPKEAALLLSLSSSFLTSTPPRVDHKSLTVLTPVADLCLSLFPSSSLFFAWQLGSWHIQLSSMSEVPLEGAMTQLDEVR